MRTASNHGSQTTTHRFLNNSKYFLQQLANTFAPQRCIRCLVAGTWLCQPCQVIIADRPPVKKCLGCGNNEYAGRICAACRPDFSLDGAVHAASYHAEWAKRGIHWLKFKGIRQVAPVLSRQTLGQLLTIAPLTQLRQQAVLIPIPLHPSRLRHRGFNQCLDIASAIAIDSTIPLADILIRRHATKTQTKLPHELRTENLAEAFTVPANTTPSPIAIIVDDVTTTGSTLNAAAQTLKQAGFTQCWGLTIARG